MADKGRVGIRYCGGCNPHYDRVALAGELERALPELTFSPAEPDAAYLAIVTVSGCPVQCASRPDQAAGPLVIPISSWDDLPCALTQLKRLSAQADALPQTESDGHYPNHSGAEGGICPY